MYRTSINTRLRYPSGDFAGMNKIEKREQSRLDVDCFLALEAPELLTPRVYELLEIPLEGIWVYGEDDEVVEVNEHQFDCIAAEYIDNLISTTLQMVYGMGQVQLNVHTLTVSFFINENLTEDNLILEVEKNA